MLLVVPDETDLRLEILPPFLVSELANMPTGLAGFATIPRLHYFGAHPKRTISSFPGYKR